MYTKEILEILLGVIRSPLVVLFYSPLAACLAVSLLTFASLFHLSHLSLHE